MFWYRYMWYRIGKESRRNERDILHLYYIYYIYKQFLRIKEK